MRMLNWLVAANKMHTLKKKEHHIVLLSEPTVYSLYCDLGPGFVCVWGGGGGVKLDDEKNDTKISYTQNKFSLFGNDISVCKVFLPGTTKSFRRS